MPLATLRKRKQRAKERLKKDNGVMRKRKERIIKARVEEETNSKRKRKSESQKKWRKKIQEWHQKIHNKQTRTENPDVAEIRK